MPSCLTLLLILLLCTCVRAQTDSTSFWNDVDLTGYAMKPFPISEKVLRKAQRNNLPWVPVAGTVAAGSVLAAVVIKPKTDKFPPVLVADSISVACESDFLDLFPLRNDPSPRGKVINVSTQGPFGRAEVLNDSTVRISNFNTLDELNLRVRIANLEGVAAESDFFVQFEDATIITQPDTYEILYREFIRVNLLENDQGLGLRLTDVRVIDNSVVSSFSFGNDGTLVYAPRPELRGTAVFLYTVTDRCGTVKSDTVRITSIDSPCNWQLDFIRQEDACGVGAGILEARVSNAQNLQYSWSSGQNVARAEGLAMGTYQLTITDPTTNCTEVITETVGFGDVNREVIQNYSINDCVSPPVLTVRLGVVPLPQFDVLLEGNGLNFTPLTLGRGEQQISLANVPPGTYDLVAYPSGFPDACRTTRRIVVRDPEPALELSLLDQTDVCGDTLASVRFLVTRESIGPISISVVQSGNAFFDYTSLISGDTITLNGFRTGNYSILVIGGRTCSQASLDFEIENCFVGGTTIYSSSLTATNPFQGSEPGGRFSPNVPFQFGFDVEWNQSLASIPVSIYGRLAISPAAGPNQASQFSADISLTREVFSSGNQRLSLQAGTGISMVTYRDEFFPQFELTARGHWQPEWSAGYRLLYWASYAPYAKGAGLIGGVSLLRPLHRFLP